jgi:hypothetical protein
MASTKSNYSWDLEISVVDGMIFIDKRQKNDKETPEQQFNILDHQTVCETSVDHQPNPDTTINGIKPLMVEA